MNENEKRNHIEKTDPRVPNPFVELDRTGSGLSFKVWCNTSKAERGHGCLDCQSFGHPPKYIFDRVLSHACIVTFDTSCVFIACSHYNLVQYRSQGQ